MATKTKFAEETQLAAVELAQLADRLSGQRATYFDRGYNDGGSDPIAGSDVSSLNTGSAPIANFITLIENFEYFLTSASITAADYSSTLNNLRTDI